MDKNPKRIPEDVAAMPDRLTMPAAESYEDALGYAAGSHGTSAEGSEENG